MLRTVRLGRTELMVSEVGFGGIPIERLSRQEAVEVVRYCYDSGITIYDSAHDYTDSEEKIGEALEPFRDKVVLTTKTLSRNPKRVAQHLEDSLKRYRTDCIDIFQFHNLFEEMELEKVCAPGGCYEVLAKAREEGRIRFIGFSSHKLSTAIMGCRTGLFDTVQLAFNFIETEAAENVFKIAEEMDLGVIIMKPLGGGLLNRADLCFRFLQQYPNVVPIPGIESKKEIDEIIGLYRSRRTLNELEWKEIEKIRSELGTKFCHRCQYCMPCEQGVDIYTIMQFRILKKAWPPKRIFAHLTPAMKTAEYCIECGECMEKCPYRLEIVDMIKEDAAAFEKYVKEHGG